MRIHVKAALALGVAASLFSGSLLMAYADDSDPTTADNQTQTSTAQAEAAAAEQAAAAAADEAQANADQVAAEQAAAAAAAGNQAPVAVDDQVTINPIQTGSYVESSDILVLDNDKGTGLSVQSVGPASHGEAVINDDDPHYVVYTPTPGFLGVDTFTYTIVANGQTATATVAVTVIAHLVAKDDYASTPQDVPVEIFVFSNDEVAGIAAIDAVSAPSHGTATANACSDDIGFYAGKVVCVTYAPAAGFTGVDGFTYTLKDDTGNESTAFVGVQVTPVQITSGGSALPPSSGPLALVAVGMVAVASAFALRMAHQ